MSPSQVGGVEVALAEDYVPLASRFYGVSEDKPMLVGMGALAVWLHRLDEFPAAVSLADLVQTTLARLNITPEERVLLFPDDDFSLEASDFEDTRDAAAYFDALCFGTGATVPTPPEFDAALTRLSLEDWRYTAEAIGLRQTTPQPVEVYGVVGQWGSELPVLRTTADGQVLHRGAGGSGLPWLRTARPRGSTRVHTGAVPPRLSYGDFMRRLVPATTEEHDLYFKETAAPFLRHCQEHTGKSVFLIEEVNRANVSEVFGEAFQVLEPGYRDTPIRLAGRSEGEENSALTVPADLLLLATANNVDRSTLPLDFAFLSRFSTVQCPPRAAEIFSALTAQSWTPVEARAFLLLLRQVEQISGYQIGHAFFYSFGPPSTVPLWYSTTIRPLLALYLTDYRRDDLARIDLLLASWR